MSDSDYMSIMSTVASSKNPVTFACAPPGTKSWRRHFPYVILSSLQTVFTACMFYCLAISFWPYIHGYVMLCYAMRWRFTKQIAAMTSFIGDLGHFGGQRGPEFLLGAATPLVPLRPLVARETNILTFSVLQCRSSRSLSSADALSVITAGRVDWLDACSMY